MSPVLQNAIKAAPAATDPVCSRWPHYDEDVIREVGEILRSGKVNALHHGQYCRAFERLFAERCRVPYAIALANGTLALELALRALDLGPGSEVIVPARSFMASASCVVAVGASPVFADIDRETQTLTAATVAAALTPRTRAILVVHLAGWPAPMEELCALAEAHDLRIIEDCAQAHGATLNGRAVGSFGDAAAFSFCTDKIISTGGEGGMVVTRRADIWRRSWSYKDHGKAPDTPPRPSQGTFRWLHESFGSNMRLTEMQAAIGHHQLAKLDTMLAARRRNAAVLDEVLSGAPALRCTRLPRGVGHAFYKYYCFVRPDELAPGWSRDRIMAELLAQHIPCGSGSCPEIYLEQAFDGTPFRPLRRLPVARELGETSLMFPVDPTLTEADMLRIGEALRVLLAGAAR